MAFSVVDTHIQNPARAGKGKRMARSRRKMSAKQIKHFGTKRQKAALKARRHAPARKLNPPKGGGRVISGYGSTVMNSGRRKKRNPGNHKIVINRARKRSNTSHRRRTKRNPELVSFLLGNPAKRSNKGMARSRKKTRRAASRSNAGTRRRRTVKRVMHRNRSRRNPSSIGSPQQMLYGGAGVLAGFVGSAALPQMILSTGNTGMAGYAATAAAAIGLGFLSHMLFPRLPSVTVGVVSGGVANLIRRIISDQTPFGSYLSMSGMGDYMVANWGPPRMNNGLFSAMAEAPGTAWGAAGSGGGMITSSGVGIQDMADIRSARPC